MAMTSPQRCCKHEHVTICQDYIGFMAYCANCFDAEWTGDRWQTSRCVGWGSTMQKAEQDLFEQLEALEELKGE